MEKETIEQLLSNERIKPKDKLDILYREYYDALSQIGYFKAKAEYLEEVIKETNELQKIIVKFQKTIKSY